MLTTILLMFAFVLFVVGGYLGPDLGAKLTRYGLACLALGLLLAPYGGLLPHGRG